MSHHNCRSGRPALHHAKNLWQGVTVATLFFSYATSDEDLRDQLETHLSGLRRQGNYLVLA